MYKVHKHFILEKMKRIRITSQFAPYEASPLLKLLLHLIGLFWECLMTIVLVYNLPFPEHFPLIILFVGSAQTNKKNRIISTFSSDVYSFCFITKTVLQCFIIFYQQYKRKIFFLSNELRPFQIFLHNAFNYSSENADRIQTYT